MQSFDREFERAKLRQTSAPIAQEEPAVENDDLIRRAEATRARRGDRYEKRSSYEAATMPDLEAGDYNSVSGKKCAAFGCCGFTAVVAIVIVAIMIDSCHIIDEGTIGIYFVQGALINETSTPGVHWAAPFVTTVEEITTRPQTDTLGPVSAVTKDGIQNTFNDIQVLTSINTSRLVPLIRRYGLQFRDTLVFDRIKEELRTFCAKHTIDEVYNTKFLDIVSDVKQNVENSIERLSEGSIKILNLVIPKPDIPRDIASNYKAV